MHSIRPSGCFWLLVVVGLVLRLWPFSVGGWLYFLSLQWKFLSFVSKKNKKLSDVDKQKQIFLYLHATKKGEKTTRVKKVSYGAGRTWLVPLFLCFFLPCSKGPLCLCQKKRKKRKKRKLHPGPERMTSAHSAHTKASWEGGFVSEELTNTI
jgi:hypothetical protein